MSETKQRSPAMVLQMAAVLAGFSAVGGWPKSLTPSKLAALQYPNEGTLQEKRAAISHRSAFLAMVKSGIVAGAIETVAIEKQGLGRHEIALNRAPNELASPEWLGRDFVATQRVETTSHVILGITPKACTTWFHTINDTPRSEYVRAWLGDAWQEEALSDAAPTANESGAGELATTNEVRTAFASAVGRSFDKFKRALEDAPAWIKGARRAPAGKGKSAGYLWDVAVLAEAITEHYKLNRKTMYAAIAAQWSNAADSFAP